MPSTILSAEETMNEIAQNPWLHEVYASMNMSWQEKHNIFKKKFFFLLQNHRILQMKGAYEWIIQISHVRKRNWTRFQDPISTELHKVNKILLKNSN